MTQEMRVFIADDEPPARARLKELLADVAAEVPTRVVGEAANGIEAIERLPQSGAAVLLLDIQMPGMGGLEVARHLALLPAAPAIVFVTAHDRHALEVFDLNALDYLMKPVRAQRLVAALRKAGAGRPPDRERLGAAAGMLGTQGARAREHLAVAERNRIVLVPVGDILFLKAEQKYVTLRTREREHLVEESLIALEREFSGQFVRVHRNCLVARAAIRGFERLASVEGDEAHWQVVLDGVEEKVPVSRRQWPVVRGLVAES
ncbi:MAG: response regulator transcription factor [Betaproteobacteria bacterium]|nr:response regulator transcription factor [Betaproteobacteria bacterium]